jgi:hypothetical protein
MRTLNRLLLTGLSEALSLVHYSSKGQVRGVHAQAESRNDAT